MAVPTAFVCHTKTLANGQRRACASEFLRLAAQTGQDSGLGDSERLAGIPRNVRTNITKIFLCAGLAYFFDA